MEGKSKKINITIGEKISNTEIDWDEEERKEVGERILSLTNEQLAVFPYLVGVRFNKEDINHVVSDIRKDGYQSVNLSPILDEANSKEDIFWWLDYFGK
jgi:hypothetical protein